MIFYCLIDSFYLNPVDLSHNHIEQNSFDSDLKDQIRWILNFEDGIRIRL